MATSLSGPAFGGQRVGGGAGPAAPAPHQGQLNEIATGGVDVGQGHSGQGGSRCDAASGFDKLATCSKRDSTIRS